MKTFAFAIMCILLSTLFLITDPITYELLQNPESIEPTKQLINHFFGLAPIPSVFNEQEKTHMKDVTLLFRIGLVLLTILIIYLATNKRWITAAKKGTFDLIALLILAALVPFEKFFEYFHQIFFPQGNWQFPADSTIIQYYPFEFFYQYAVLIAIHSILVAGMFLYLRRKIVSNKEQK